MEMHQVVVAQPGLEGYVELSNTRTGRLFQKHILNKGPLIHPQTHETINIDDDFIAKLTANFDAGICDIVQFPIAGDKNEHSEDPLRNAGKVVGIKTEGDKVYAMIDVRKPDVADELGETLLGASGMLNLNYFDSKTGKKVGPTLLHVAVTNRPYITNLDGFEEILAASAEGDDKTLLLTPATTEVLDESAAKPKSEIEDPMDLETLLATLKVEHGIDVKALQAQAAEAAPALAMSAALSKALVDSDMISLSAGEEVASTDVILSAISTLASENVKLTDSLDKVKLERAEAEVQGYIDAGRLLPKQKAGMVHLSMTDRDTFDSLLPDDAIIKLSNELGVAPANEDPDSADPAKLALEIDRYVSLAQPHLAAVKQ